MWVGNRPEYRLTNRYHIYNGYLLVISVLLLGSIAYLQVFPDVYIDIRCCTLNNLDRKPFFPITSPFFIILFTLSVTMVSTKPTVVLVHGAWHVPASYDKLTTSLRLAGYEVHVPLLTSMNGTKSPDGDLVTDTALIRSCVEGLVEDGRTVIALLHSYGGQVGSNALHGLSFHTRAKQGLGGGVSNLIYMCGFILPENWSTMNQAHALGMKDEKAPQLNLAFDEDGYCTMAAPREQLINNVSDDSQAAAYISTLVPWNIKAMQQPLSHCAWKEIPVTYIHTINDKTVSFASQQLMLERLKEHGLPDPRLVLLNTDHCPFLTATEEVVDTVNKAAATIKDGRE